METKKKREICKYKHRQPKSFKCYDAKEIALADIKEDGNRNYIGVEYLILKIKDVHNDYLKI